MVSDFVVVGGGVAGCVVSRVLADSGAAVTLVEAGLGELPDTMRNPDWLDASHDLDWRWPGDYPRGRGLGGGSAINAMVVAVPQHSEYDEWPEGWRYNDIGPHIDSVLATIDLWSPKLGALASRVAAVGADISPVRLMASSDGLRRTFADAYLTPAANNLTVRTSHAVARLVTAGDAVTGIEFTDGETLPAGRVILCAGTCGTADLLAASDINLNPRHALDHRSLGLTLGLDPDIRSAALGTPPVSALIRGASFEVLIMDHLGESRGHGALLVGELEPGGLVEGMKLARAIGASLQNDGVAAGAVESPGGYYHAASTLPGGTAVDLTGAPEGWTGLHVMDASVLPSLVRCSPSVAIAAMARLMATALAS